MRALIPGDRGFLGRHFTAELRSRGWEVYGLDTKASSAQDCRNYFRSALLTDPPAGPRYDLVVHCAAVVGGRETIENDPLATAESLSIDAEMFRWAAVARPGRVLYISSSAAYPVNLQHGTTRLRLREDDLWGAVAPAPGTLWDLAEPDEIYGWSKVTGELLVDRLRRTGVPVTVVRPFSGYGADQDPSYPFRAILDRARGLEPGQALDLWSDGTRDWIHVDDLVRGALAVADSETELPVNLCTGRATRFSELAGIVLRALGKPPRYRVLDDRPKGVAYRVGDPSRLNGIYRTQVSLEDGVRRALSGS